MKFLQFPRTFLQRAGTYFSVVLIALSITAPAIASGGGGSKKSVPATGERKLQLPPIWVPVNVNAKKKGAPHHAPVTIILTTQDGAAVKACSKRFQLIEAYLFAMHEANLKMDRNHKVDVGPLKKILMQVAEQTTDKNTIKSVEAFSGVLHVKEDEKDIQAECR